MKNYWTIALLLLNTFAAHAQIVRGKVLDSDKRALIGAHITWQNQKVGTVSNALGEFELQRTSQSDTLFVVSFIGFESETLRYEASKKFYTIQLKGDKTLKTFEVESEKAGQIIIDSPIKMEAINSVELKKGACCDLAGCFNTSASVQPATSNVITNSKELRILGLSAVYNQVLLEGFPVFHGLGYTYGVSAISGTLIDNIYIVKGANSVLQGYESISGQINVVPQSGEGDERLFLNVYANSFGETQYNIQHKSYLGKRKEWNNIAAVYVVLPAQRIDYDNDRFLDVPLHRHVTAYNKLSYRDDKLWGWSAKFGLQYVAEERLGGQINYNPKNDLGSSTIFGHSINYNQATTYAKAGYRFNDDRAVFLYASGFLHNQRSWFGQTRYAGNQNNNYINLQFEQKWLEKHELKMGFSYRLSEIDENISFSANPLNKTFAGDYNRYEYIPGLFAENQFSWFNNKLILVAGIRSDYHNLFGWRTSPRSLLKFDLNSKTTLRASLGYGWRTPQVFSEHLNLLGGQRDVLFRGSLQAEEALNYGFNFLKRFEWGEFNGYFSADYYHTVFYRQLFPDYDSDPTLAIVESFEGNSCADGVQLDFNINYGKNYSLRLGYNFQEVYMDYPGERRYLPFIPQHRFLAAVSYKTNSDKWQFDLNVHGLGKQNIPLSFSVPNTIYIPEDAKPFALLNAQVTRKSKQFDVYFGVENILNFRQHQSFRSWQDPFNPYFDVSHVWGPTRGIEVYLGLRHRIFKVRN